MARQRTATDVMLSYQEVILDNLGPGDETGFVARNIGRSGMIIANDSAAKLSIRYHDRETPDSYIVAVLYPQGLWEMPEPTYVGPISLRVDGGGLGVVLITEL